MPETIGAGDRTPIVTLTGERRTRFPIRAGWPLAVERRAGGVRVEPLSAMTVPEWDLLVGSGRLDLLTREQADALTNQKWFDEILGLAGAYAVYAARDWEYLGVVVQNLRYLPHAGLDVDLLDIALTHRKPGRLGAAAVARLERVTLDGGSQLRGIDADEAHRDLVGARGRAIRLQVEGVAIVHVGDVRERRVNRSLDLGCGGRVVSHRAYWRCPAARRAVHSARKVGHDVVHRESDQQERDGEPCEPLHPHTVAIGVTGHLPASGRR